MWNTSGQNWLTRTFYRFIVLPVLMIVGFLVSVVMILLSPLILLAGLGAMKLWMRRLNRQARSWQDSQRQYVKSYTVETVADPAEAEAPRQLPGGNSENTK